MRIEIGCVCLFLLAWLPASIGTAAIDCSRVTSNVERLICSNSRAAAAEEKMAQSFWAALRRGVPPAELRESQRIWLNEVRNACNDVECLLRAHERRILELDSLAAG